MNKIIVSGNIVRDIELKYTQGGTAIANGTIAVRRSFKNKDGEYETDFFNFVVMGKAGETVANYMKKGNKVVLAGSLQNRVWIKDDGSKQYFTEIFVDSFDLPSKQDSGQQQGQQPARQQQRQEAPKNEFGDPFANNGQAIDISDDSLPF